jgi:hypothetical protein
MDIYMDMGMDMGDPGPKQKPYEIEVLYYSL